MTADTASKSAAESGSKILTREQLVDAAQRLREAHPDEETGAERDERRKREGYQAPTTRTAPALKLLDAALHGPTRRLARQLHEQGEALKRAKRTPEGRRLYRHDGQHMPVDGYIAAVADMRSASRRPGHAPRRATNVRAKGSRRRTGSSTSRGDPPGDDDPPGLADPPERACARVRCLHSLPPGSAPQRRYCGRPDCNRERQNARQQALRVRGGRDRPLDYDFIPYGCDLTRMWIAGDRELAEHLACELRDLTLGQIEDCPAQEASLLTRRSALGDGSREDKSPDVEAPEAEVVGLDDAEEIVDEPKVYCEACKGYVTAQLDEARRAEDIADGFDFNVDDYMICSDCGSLPECPCTCESPDIGDPDHVDGFCLKCFEVVPFETWERLAADHPGEQPIERAA